MALKKISRAIIGGAGFIVLLNVKQLPNNIPADKRKMSVIQTKTLPETNIVQKTVWTASLACLALAMLKKFTSLSVFKKICFISAGLLIGSSIIFGFGNTVNFCILSLKAAGCFVVNLFSPRHAS